MSAWVVRMWKGREYRTNAEPNNRTGGYGNHVSEGDVSFEGDVSSDRSTYIDTDAGAYSNSYTNAESYTNTEGGKNCRYENSNTGYLPE